MIQEIDMTPGQAIVFVLLLLFLIWKIWHLKGSQSSPEPLRATKSNRSVELYHRGTKPRIWGLYSACRTQVQLKGDKNMKIAIFDHNKLNRNAFYVKELDVLFVADTVSEEEKQSLIQQCGK